MLCVNISVEVHFKVDSSGRIIGKRSSRRWPHINSIISYLQLTYIKHCKHIKHYTGNNETIYYHSFGNGKYSSTTHPAKPPSYAELLMGKSWGGRVFPRGKSSGGGKIFGGNQKIYWAERGVFFHWLGEGEEKGEVTLFQRGKYFCLCMTIIIWWPKKQMWVGGGALII